MANSPKRVVRTFDATSMVAGNIIGSAIFLLSGYAAAPVLDGTWLIGAWIVGGIVATLGALAIAELSTKFPDIGGDFLYLKKVYGTYPAFLYGWMSLMIFETGSIAILSIFGGKYLKDFFPGAPLSVPALASVLVILFSGLHCLRITIGSRFQSILTVAKIGGLGLLSVILFSNTSSVPAVESATAVEGSPLIGFSRALIPIFFAYTGWNVAGYIAGEIHNPRKTLPFALIGGTVITTVIYIIVQLGFLKAIGLEAMRNEEMVPLVALKAVGAEGWSTFLSILIFVSIFSSLSITIQTAGARVIQAMGKHGVFFRFTAKLHPRFKTPVNALIIQAAWCIVLMYALDIDSLVDSTTVVMILFSALTISTLLKINWKGRPGQDAHENHYSTPLFPLVPVAYIGSALFVSWGVIRFYLDKGSYLPALGFAFLTLGSVVFLIWKRLEDRGKK
jgi:APA family basic amino acid/polyamine antiporter